MPTYVSLLKFTEQGVKTVKDVPARFDAARKMVEGFGGKILAIYATMGNYDIVAITEGPSDETAAAAALSLAARGNDSTITMRAFTEREFAEIVAKVL